MKKPDFSKKAIRFRKARARYSAKRRTVKWKNRKRHNLLRVTHAPIENKRKLPKKFIPHRAPSNLSLIDNTNETLAYFEEAHRLLHDGNNITLDISNVDNLTSPTVALMIACINNKDYLAGSNVSGNAPVKPKLKRLFTESGFYEHVLTRGHFARGNENYLHKEMSRSVDSEVAMEATHTGTKHVFGNDNPFDPVYDTLIECMQNTNNHANIHQKGECYWWLYVYSDPESKKSTYSFLDLGVGIFNSVKVRSYINKIKQKSPFHGNISLVDDLLSGKIGSRMTKDHVLRGKGLPQIFKDAQLKSFSSFYIIVNDVKIDLKTGTRVKLSSELKGTFLYWELVDNTQ